MADAPNSPEVVPLGLVRRLCDSLEAERINYCHWKSNQALDRSARGESDLDLLIDPRDIRRFEEIIRHLGFKRGRAPSMRRMPGVFHAYGFDEPSGRIVHIHAHERLVLGDDTTKNYRLPIEAAYLRSAMRGPTFRVPAPEFELVVFVVRMVLKHCTLDAMLVRKGRLSPGEARELEHLTGLVDVPRAESVVAHDLPWIGSELWEGCLRCLRPGASTTFRARTALALERSLAGHARRSPALDPLVRTWRRALVAGRRHVFHRPPPRNRLEDGGAVIAIVGGDGAGKTTAVEEIRRWLSKDLDVVTIHLGKPPKSMTSAFVHAVWRGGTHRTRSSRASEAERSPVSITDGERIGPRSLAKLVRKVMTSRDRSLGFARARRLASDGRIVVTDRFPLPEVTLMDGPSTASIPTLRAQSKVVAGLARLEDRYYGRVGRPDVLIVLRVPPEVAVQRRRGIEDEQFVRRRAEEIWGFDWSHRDAVVIDADLPKDEVSAKIRSAIWMGL